MNVKEKILYIAGIRSMKQNIPLNGSFIILNGVFMTFSDREIIQAENFCRNHRKVKNERFRQD